MAIDDLTSRSLLIRVRSDDQQAWRRLVDLYSPLVAYWCRRWGAAPGDVADVAQDVFAAVALSVKTYRQDEPGASFRAWLRGIVRHKLTDYLRRVGGRAEGGTEALQRLQEVADEGPDASGDDGELGRLYRRALEQVRAHFEERTWQAFWRVAVEDRTPEDVAAELGITANGVRQAKSRVLRRLKEELGDLIT